MAVGFGGSPLLSTLIGAAKGFSNAQKESNARQRQAMLDALRRANSERAERALGLQERRFRARQRDDRLEGIRAEEDARRGRARARDAQESFEEFRSARVPELIEGGMQPAAAMIQARREFAGDTNPFVPEPEEPPEAPDEGERLLNEKRRMDIEEERGERALLDDRRLRSIIQGSEDENAALLQFRQLKEEGETPDVSEGQFVQAFRESREEEGDTGGRSESLTPKEVAEQTARSRFQPPGSGMRDIQDVIQDARDGIAHIDRRIEEVGGVVNLSPAQYRATLELRNLYREILNNPPSQVRETLGRIGVNLRPAGSGG